MRARGGKLRHFSRSSMVTGTMRRIAVLAGITSAVFPACASERAAVVGEPRTASAPAPHALRTAEKSDASFPPLRGKSNRVAFPLTSLGAMNTPVALEAAASNAAWGVYCQARGDTDGDGTIAVRVGPQGELAGDELSSFLAVAGAEERAIDELLAYDESGRWLAIDIEGRVELVDTVTGSVVELRDADRARDASWFAPHRALSFDAQGRQLLYAVPRQGHAVARLRKLNDGSEREIVLGAGALWRTELSHDGAWALFRVLVDDATGNGRLDWPVPRRTRNRWRCRGPVPRYPAWIGIGDRPSWVVAGTSKLKPAPEPEFVMPFGTGLILRDTKGALLLERRGRRAALVPADCGAQVLHADPTRDLVLVACGGDETPPAFQQPVVLVGPGLYRPLGFDIGPAGGDTWPALTPRLVALYPGRDTVLVDLERRSVEPLRPNDVVIATAGPKALIRRGSTLLVHDVDGAPESTLATNAEVAGEHRVTGTFAYAAPYVVDVAVARLAGKVHGALLALGADGRALVAARDATEGELARGPLTWAAPAPP